MFPCLISVLKISQKIALLPSSCESMMSSTLLDFPGPDTLPAQKTNTNFPQNTCLTAAVVFRNPTIAVDLWSANLDGIALKCETKYCKLIQILLLLVRHIHITLRQTHTHYITSDTYTLHYVRHIHITLRQKQI